MNITPRTARGFLLGAALLITAVQIFRLPTQAPAADPNKPYSGRAELAMRYVLFEKLETAQFEKDLKPHLDEIQKKPKLSPDTMEALGLTYLMVDAKPDQVQNVLDQLPEMDHRELVLFAAGLGEPPEPGWEKLLPADLFGAWLGSAVYKRLGDTQHTIEETFRYRAFEHDVSQTVLAQSLISGLTLLGMGLLISLFLSARNARRLGVPFFLLPPLYMQRGNLFLFFGAYLLINQFILVGSGYLLKGIPLWAQESIGTLMTVVVSVVLARKWLFNSAKTQFFKAMGLENLKLNFFSIFQILGGVAICLAGVSYGQMVGAFAHWPTTSAVQSHLGVLADSPLAGIIYLLVVCILGAALEEILFRGLLLRALLGFMKPSHAIALSAALFAMTFPMTDWLVGFGMGFALALSHYRTANLFVNIAIHALWNCLFLVLIIMGLA